MGTIHGECGQRSWNITGDFSNFSSGALPQLILFYLSSIAIEPLLMRLFSYPSPTLFLSDLTLPDRAST